MNATAAPAAAPVAPPRAALLALAGLAFVPLLRAGFVPYLGVSVALACVAARWPGASVPFPPSPATRRLAQLATLALAVAALGLLPLPALFHEWLAPGATALDRELGGAPRFAPSSRDPAATRLALLALAVGAALVASVRSIARAPRARALLAAALVAGAALVALIGVSEALLGTPLLQRSLPPHARPFGPFANRNHAGALLLLALPLALAGARRAAVAARLGALCTDRLARAAWTAAATLLVLGLLLNGSRGVALAALLTTAFTLAASRLALRPKLLLGGAVALLLVVPSAAFERRGDATTISERLTLAGDALRMAKDAPLLGIGLNAFGAAYPPYQTVERDLRFRHVECEPLELLVEGGLPLALAGLAAAALLLRVAARVVRRGGAEEAALAAAALAVPFHALCDFPLRVPGVALPFALAVGLLLAVHDAGTGAAETAR